MLHIILISGIVGVVLGVIAFWFGHAVAAKYWKELADKLTTGKILAEDEATRLRSALRTAEEKLRELRSKL